MRTRLPATIGLLLGLNLISMRTACGLEPVVEEWVVDNVVRRATVHLPEPHPTNGAPVVFVFHGHGGSMTQAARSFRLHALWPQALVVYPQGLRTPGPLTDPRGERSGWQHNAGDQEDRDLKFFDAMCERLGTRYSADTNCIFATGHSNGGRFVYLLWETRGERLRAVAPSGAVLSWRARRNYRPKPVLHIAGQTDSLVEFRWQERTIDWLRELNRCGEGVAWAGHQWCTLYPSEYQTPVVTFIYPGGHRFPSGAGAIIVRFFREWPNGDPSAADGSGTSPPSNR